MAARRRHNEDQQGLFPGLVSAPFMPSVHQEAILDWIRTGTGHAAIKAVAGAGKTTTLRLVAQAIYGASLVYMAFNRHTKIDAEAKFRKLGMRQVACRTVHSHSRGALVAEVPEVQGLKPADSKYYSMAAKVWQQLRGQEVGYKEYRGRRLTEEETKALLIERGYADMASRTAEILDFVRHTLAINEMEWIVDHFGIYVPPELEQLTFQIVCDLLERGFSMRKEEFDYGDMLWLPIRGNFRQQTFDWILVDECQDLSLSKIDVIRRSMHANTRIIAVGDPYQAIYGFTGADADAFDTMVESFDATVLPLDVCYRCPKSHLDMARKFCPEIMPATTAAVGTLREISMEQFFDEMKAPRSTDRLVICRSNAPLIWACYELVGHGVKAKIVGRDDLEGPLVLMLHKVRARSHGYNEFLRDLEGYVNGELAKLSKKQNVASKVRRLQDGARCLEVLHLRSAAKSYADLEETIRELFRGKAELKLSSVHRAKGLEADHVYILEPSQLRGHDEPALTWEQRQEHNIHYVALTRAKQSLTFVESAFE